MADFSALLKNRYEDTRKSAHIAGDSASMRSGHFCPDRETRGSEMQGPFDTQGSWIGKSIVIKGEITASDALYVSGSVEGLISAPEHRVTIGKEGSVKADIGAHEVVILGDVCGSLDAGSRAEIRSSGSLTGKLAADRILIEEGAILRGSIAVRKKIEARHKLHTAQELPAAPIAEPDFDRSISEATAAS